MAYAKQLLDEIGLDARRLEMVHIGASDAPKWVRTVREMTARALELGPNPLKKRSDPPAAKSQGDVVH